MGYKIGMDFGTTNSTVSYVERDQLAPFKYPAADGTEYIPSCVAYDEDGVHIGRAALDCIETEGAVFCNNLKMVLPLPEERRRDYGWPARKAPEAVIADYLRHILVENGAESPSFAVQKGDIEGVVLSVPHVWDSIDHAGRLRLQEIVKQDLGLPLIQLISEPVAAAACFAYRHQQEAGRPFEGNLLICDMGGGTFDVTLCQVGPGRVTELHNDGNGRRAMGKAGVAFDRELLRIALARQGVPYETDGPLFYEFYRKLQEYKTNHHPKITQKLINAMEDPDLRDTAILRAGKLAFSYPDIAAAFTEVAEGIDAVLTRFKAAADAKGHAIDAVFFVGGFCQFHLVREHIKRILNLESARLFADANREVSRFAISFGAALMANDMLTVEERYDHTLGIVGWVPVEDAPGKFRREERRIPIISGGKKLGEYEATHFAAQPVKVYDESPRITLYVAPHSEKRIFAEDLPESMGVRLPGGGLPGQELWRVGMRINGSKVVYLVFESDQGTRVEYELGDIIRKMFGRPEIIMGGD